MGSSASTLQVVQSIQAPFQNALNAAAGAVGSVIAAAWLSIETAIDSSVVAADRLVENAFKDAYNQIAQEFANLYDKTKESIKQDIDDLLVDIQDEAERFIEFNKLLFIGFVTPTPASSSTDPPPAKRQKTLKDYFPSRKRPTPPDEPDDDPFEDFHDSTKRARYYDLGTTEGQRFLRFRAFLNSLQFPDPPPSAMASFRTKARTGINSTSGSGNPMAFAFHVRVDSQCIGSAQGAALDGSNGNLAAGASVYQQMRLNVLMNMYKFFRLASCTLHWFPNSTMFFPTAQTGNTFPLGGRAKVIVFQEEVNVNKYDGSAGNITFGGMEHYEMVPGTTQGFHDQPLVHTFKFPLRNVLRQDYQNNVGSPPTIQEESGVQWLPTKTYNNSYVPAVTPNFWERGIMYVYDPMSRTAPSSPIPLGHVELICDWVFKQEDINVYNITPIPASTWGTMTTIQNPAISTTDGPTDVPVDLEAIMDTALATQVVPALHPQSDSSHPLHQSDSTLPLAPPSLVRTPAVAGISSLLGSVHTPMGGQPST